MIRSEQWRKMYLCPLNLKKFPYFQMDGIQQKSLIFIDNKLEKSKKKIDLHFKAPSPLPLLLENRTGRF